MTNDVLLIFLNDSLEQTKLSQSLGEEKAQEINKRLQIAVYSAAKSIDCNKIVLTSRDYIE